MKPIAREDWEGFFDGLSQVLANRKVGVEIAGEDVGDQLQLVDTLLTGLSYDPRDDAFDVVTPQLDHRVEHPREIWIDESREGLKQVIVIDADGRRQLVNIQPPLSVH
jgi:hypothetical protein